VKRRKWAEDGESYVVKNLFKRFYKRFLECSNRRRRDRLNMQMWQVYKKLSQKAWREEATWEDHCTDGRLILQPFFNKQGVTGWTRFKWSKMRFGGRYLWNSLDLFLSQMHPVHTLTPYLIFHFNSTLLSTPMSWNWCFLFWPKVYEPFTSPMCATCLPPLPLDHLLDIITLVTLRICDSRLPPRRWLDLRSSGVLRSVE
jgi:hypothetical protein